MTLSAKAISTIDRRSVSIAASETTGSDDGGISGLHTRITELRRHRDGKYYTIQCGGGGVHVDRQPRWMTREQAIEWIVEYAESNTGYGYTRDQAEIMVDADYQEAAGKGWVKQTEVECLHDRPDCDCPTNRIGLVDCTCVWPTAYEYEWMGPGEGRVYVDADKRLRDLPDHPDEAAEVLSFLMDHNN